MRFDNLKTLPVQVTVSDIVESRYPGHKRPESWSLRRSGRDIIRTSSGDLLPLLSDGGQTPPPKNSVILIRAGDNTAGYSWTLYGLPPQPGQT